MKHFRRLTAFLLAMMLIVTAGCGRKSAETPLQDRIENAGEVVASIRRGLKNHAQTITITFDYGSDIFDELNSVIDLWVEAVLAETDDPTEGDYIRYQYGGYTYTSSYAESGGRFQYTVKLTPDYFCYLSQEERASERADELLDSFGFRP